jgi:hypothetical protein
MASSTGLHTRPALVWVIFVGCLLLAVIPWLAHTLVLSGTNLAPAYTTI